MKKMFALIILFFMLSMGAVAEGIENIIPDASIWGISSDTLKHTYEAEYKQCHVNGDDGWYVNDVELSSYPMDVYYIIGEKGLSKIVYILNDYADRTEGELSQCYQALVKEMRDIAGEPTSEKKNDVKWKTDKYSIEIGKGKMKKYTGSDYLTVAIVFKTGGENAENKKETFDVLEVGSSGDEVVTLQKRLDELGYAIGAIDGNYGNKTKDAITKFQIINTLSVTGTADAPTQKLLFSEKAVCNLETIKGLSIIEAMKNTISSAPTQSKKSSFTYEHYGDIRAYISDMGIVKPNSITISNWSIVFDLSGSSDKHTISLTDEKNTCIMYTKGKGKPKTLIPTMQWECDFFDMLPSLKEKAKANGIRIKKMEVRGAYSGNVDSDISDLADHNGVIDLNDSYKLEKFAEVWHSHKGMTEAIAAFEVFGQVDRN